MTVITRFAPSPTGYLHIGGARTALFNYLFAKHHRGKFLLRIEDTDQARSTQEAVDAILYGMKWLGLDHDDEIIYQMSRAQMHADAAKSLIDKGAAYYCYTPQEEIQSKREEAASRGEHYVFTSPWRDALPSQAPKNQKATIRIKAPRTGVSIINDHVQGAVEVVNSELDDLVLLRSDGTPTYNLAVVVDDIDMKISHIIRGDDHLNNAFRQSVIYNALGAKIPEMAHIPLIHGPDGAKLSKRHGAVGLHFYEDEGYLPEAIINYLLRLGWSHGNDEIISREQAIEWFSLEALGKSAARLDFNKMLHLNAHYIKNTAPEKLNELVSKNYSQELINLLKPRVNTLKDLTNQAEIYASDSTPSLNAEALATLDKLDRVIIEEIVASLKQLSNWNIDFIKASTQEILNSQNKKLSEIGPVLRVLLTGSVNAPGIFEVMQVLGKDKTITRLLRIF